MTRDDDAKPDRWKSPKRAARRHQGPGHWHVEKRSNVLLCRMCGATIPLWKDPKFCPECGAGRPDA